MRSNREKSNIAIEIIGKITIFKGIKKLFRILMVAIIFSLTVLPMSSFHLKSCESKESGRTGHPPSLPRISSRSLLPFSSIELWIKKLFKTHYRWWLLIKIGKKWGEVITASVIEGFYHLIELFFYCY